MIHTFDAQRAVKYGVNAAILFEDILANSLTYRNGRHWLRSSVRQFRENHPYMSTKAINNALKTLAGAGQIAVGSFNDDPHDRTLWYAVCDERYLR